MPILTHSEHILGDMLVRYQAPSDNPEALGLSIIPLARRADLVPARDHLDAACVKSLPARWQPVRAWEVDPLVHIHLAGHPYPSAFAAGRTLRGSASTRGLRFKHQAHETTPKGHLIRTHLAGEQGMECVHELELRNSERALRARTTIHNNGPGELTLELLTTFSLGGITPFAPDDAAGRLWVHRLRSAWSAEGRHEECALEDLHLERSWVGYGVACERFGQVGSMPVNGWFPLAAVEDRTAGVTWGARLAMPGSWQLELFRRQDQLALSGGQADREFGHWWKTLAPGESFTSPEAFLAVASGGFDDICTRLNTPLVSDLEGQPEHERTLPVVFNEWCSSWGNPNHDNLVLLANRLKDTGVRYLVIDDGWAERPGDGIQQNGDWVLNQRSFPSGLRATADAIRACGLIPGIWFEFEVINAGSKAWDETTHQLQRDGRPLEVGTRRFWDFRDPWVHAYLAERVIRLLKDNHLGYLKVDYNDSIGLGHDGAESPGEALRQNLAGVQTFFRRLRLEIPDLVIENCSSGGHRLEPSMLALSAMSSFSDAHESPDIPIIAANLHRVLLPRQNQIWAVLREDDSLQRLSYSLAATFLGRMCLSGDVHALPPQSWKFIQSAITLYCRLVGVIAAVSPVRCGTIEKSWQHPRGQQAVLFCGEKSLEAFVVWHAFAEPAEEIVVPLPPGRYRAVECELTDLSGRAIIRNDDLVIRELRPFSGGIIVLAR